MTFGGAFPRDETRVLERQVRIRQRTAEAAPNHSTSVQWAHAKRLTLRRSLYLRLE